MPNCTQTLIDYNPNHFPTVSSVLALFYLTTIAIGRVFFFFFFLLEQSSLMNSPKKDGDDDVPVKDPVKYGELVILG